MNTSFQDNQLTKTIPPPLKDHILPFNWDVSKVWALHASTETRPRSEFDHLLHLPLWSSRQGAGMLFDVTPMEVIQTKDRFPYQFAGLTHE